MATITNTQVTTALGLLNQNWFGPFDSVTGVVNGETEDDEEFTFDTAGDVEVTITYLDLIEVDLAHQIILAAVIDDIAGDVAAGDYGPLTRVTELEDLPYNDVNGKKIELTTVNGNTIYLTYDEIKRESLLLERVRIAEGYNAKVDAILAKLVALKVVTDAFPAVHTAANYKTLINGLLGIEEIRGHF